MQKRRKSEAISLDTSFNFGIVASQKTPKTLESPRTLLRIFRLEWSKRLVRKNCNGTSQRKKRLSLAPARFGRCRKPECSRITCVSVPISALAEIAIQGLPMRPIIALPCGHRVIAKLNWNGFYSMNLALQ